jgi:phospholipid transport system transporter-binding protein
VSAPAEGGAAAASLQGDGVLAVRGALTFATVSDLYPQSEGWIRDSAGPVTVDLKDVRRADSAGLALLVEWLRLARAGGRELRFINVSEQVRSLARVNGLGRALQIDNQD